MTTTSTFTGLSGSRTEVRIHQRNVPLSAAMPHARLRALEGQTHEVDPAVQAPVLAEFFAG